MAQGNGSNNTSGTNKAEEGAAATTSGPLSRDQMRAKIFSAKPRAEEIDFFGARIELRQPSLGTILDMRAGSVEMSAMQMLMDFAYLPGTNEKVFEAADEDNLRQLPFGEDLQRLMAAVNSLMGIDSEGLQKQIADAIFRAGEGASSADDNAGGAEAG